MVSARGRSGTRRRPKRPRAGRRCRSARAPRRRNRPREARAGRAGPPSRAARRRRPWPRKISWLNWSTVISIVPSKASSLVCQSTQAGGGAPYSAVLRRSATKARSSRGRGEPTKASEPSISLASSLARSRRRLNRSGPTVASAVRSRLVRPPVGRSVSTMPSQVRSGRSSPACSDSWPERMSSAGTGKAVQLKTACPGRIASSRCSSGLPPADNPASTRSRRTGAPRQVREASCRRARPLRLGRLRAAASRRCPASIRAGVAVRPIPSSDRSNVGRSARSSVAAPCNCPSAKLTTRSTSSTRCGEAVRRASALPLRATSAASHRGS